MTNPNGQPVASRGLSRVGLWGAPSSGKTTYLAALNVAVQLAAADELMIYGTDDASTDFLVDNTARLTRDRHFPPPTAVEQQLSWVVNMNVDAPVRRRFRRTQLETAPFQLNLDLLDEPGEVYNSSRDGIPPVGAGGGTPLGFDDEDDGEDDAPGTGAATEESVMDDLAGCDGLLLLFDPTKEWEDGDAYNYFQGTLLRIAQRRLSGRTDPGARLPHYVAVCVTKFDHPDVYWHAKKRGYRSFDPDDPYLFPRVPNELAEKFFADLVHETERGNANLMPNALRRYFYPDRVRFFVVSAIGFYLSRKVNRFQDQNFMNTVAEPGGGPRIRGAIHPINVVEPLVWLGRSLAADRRDG